MNFFGHAVIASRSDRRAGHVLGSMLPDFETMAGAHVLDVHDSDIRRGIGLHHRTDEAFHRAPAFLALCARALDELTESGVRRGTARAVGHIGTEMFLDGWLAQANQHSDAYLSALALEVSDRLEWNDAGAGYSKLQGRLSRWGPPVDYGDPSFVMARLRDTLRRRPALEVLEAQSSQVSEYLPFLQKLVRERALELLQEVEDALGFGD